MNAEELAAAKLGKAVHPNALARLFELFPKTEIRVQHHKPTFPGASGVTQITAEIVPGVRFVGRAMCAPGDQFNRRTGIKLAFDRILESAREAA